MPKNNADQRRRWSGEGTSVIGVCVGENPKKLGTKCRDRFDLYRNGMTVDDYVSACRKAPRAEDALIDITWDLAHGFIEVYPPGTRLS